MLGTTGLVATGVLFGIALALALTHLFRPNRTPFTPALVVGGIAVVCGALSLPGSAAFTFLASVAVLLVAGALTFRIAMPRPNRTE